MISMAPPPKAGAQPAAGDALLDTMKAILEETKRSSLARKSEIQQTLDNAKKDIIATAFGPVLKLVEAISKMVAMFIMPFANLLMPLIMPMLYFLAPIVKFLNISLRPLFTKMMETAKNIGQKGAAGAAGDILSGAGSGLVSMISGYGDLIKSFFEEIKPYVSGFTDWFIKFLGSLDVEAILTSIWDAISGTLEKIWGVIAPVLDKLWAQLAPWLQAQFPDLFKVVDDIRVFIDNAKAVFGGGPSGLVGAIVAQAKFFGQDISKFIFEALASGLKLAFDVQRGITQALISVTSVIFGAINSLDENIFVPIMKMIRDIVVPISQVIFDMLIAFDKDVLLPFRKAATLIVPAIMAMAAPAGALKDAAMNLLTGKKSEIDQMQGLISQKTIESFEINNGALSKNLTTAIEGLPERMAARSELEYGIEAGLATISSDIGTLIATLNDKALGLQQSIDSFLEVKDKDGRIISKAIYENAEVIDQIQKDLKTNEQNSKYESLPPIDWAKVKESMTKNTGADTTATETAIVGLCSKLEGWVSRVETRLSEPQRIGITLVSQDQYGTRSSKFINAYSGSQTAATVGGSSV